MFGSRIKIFVATAVFVLFFLVILFFVIRPERINYSPSNPSEVSEEISRLTIGDTVIDIEIVRTEDERRKGLSGREYLAYQSGMLFVFDKPDFHGIWMKDMNFPIDIIWLDENFEIVDILIEALPSSYPTVYVPKKKSLYVLEVVSGFVDDNNISIGDRLKF